MRPPTDNWGKGRTEHCFCGNRNGHHNTELTTQNTVTNLITQTQNKDMQNKDATQKTKQMNNTDPTNKPGVNSGAREG